MLNKKYLLALESLIVLFLIISIVGASGIAAPNWDTPESYNPLYLFTGESRVINFELQNLGTNEDVTFRMDITNGSNIAQLVDANNIYLVKANERQKVPVRISVLADAKVGDKYRIKVEATSVETQKSGQFKFGTSVGTSFDVIVTAQAPKEEAQTETEAQTSSINWIIYLLLAIIIVIIIYFALKRKKK